jgi:hypothetical protein
MSENRPDWLPDLISTDGNWKEEILPNLYNIFRKDFIYGRPKLGDKKVYWNKTKDKDNKYENGFWHLITIDNSNSNERIFDPRRAERLPWCAPSIKHFNNDIIKYWEYKESANRINIYLWLENLDYVIIFEKRKINGDNIAFMLTAYYVGSSTKKKLRRKYNERLI